MSIEQQPLSAQEMVAVLQTATSATPDRRLPGVLGDFRRQWAAIAHHRYPSLGSDLDDALQESLVKLTDGQRLATLRDPQQIESWARSLFVHTVLDVLKAEVLHTRGRATSDAAEALIERLPSAAPSTEDLVAAQERLRTLRECVARIDVARLKFIDGLPDREIATRCGLTRDGVAGRLKRLRKLVRAVLNDADTASEAPRSGRGAA